MRLALGLSVYIGIRQAAERFRVEIARSSLAISISTSMVRSAFSWASPKEER